jgi:WD40 repeat protein
MSPFDAKSAICQLASSSEDLTVRVWDIERGEVVAILEGHKIHINRVLFSQDGRFLATASTDKTVRLWDADTYRLLGELPHGSAVYGLAFSPDGTHLATACADKTIRLWDLERRQEVAQLLGHREYVHAVSYSRDGTRIASASGDATVRIGDSLAPSERLRASGEQRP